MIGTSSGESLVTCRKQEQKSAVDADKKEQHGRIQVISKSL